MGIEKLSIYVTSKLLVKDVYLLIGRDKLKNDWSLCDQIKRASISVCANISEGYLRTKKQSKNYLQIATGSVNEVITLLELIRLIYQIDTKIVIDKYIVLSRQIGSYSKYIQTNSAK